MSDSGCKSSRKRTHQLLNASTRTGNLESPLAQLKPAYSCRRKRRIRRRVQAKGEDVRPHRVRVDGRNVDFARTSRVVSLAAEEEKFEGISGKG